jgi:hypothetical protein
MKPMTLLAASILLILAVSAATMAVAAENLSSIDFLGRAGSDGSSDYDLDTEIAIDRKSTFSVGFSKDQTPVTATQTDNLDTRELRVGYDYDSSEHFSDSFNYTLWGQTGEITTNTFDVGLQWAFENWSALVTPAVRFIGVTYTRRSSLSTKDNFVDPSVDISVKYKGLWPFYVKAIGAYYWYNKDISILANSNAVKFFSASALTLADSIQTYQAGAELGYVFSLVKVGFEHIHSVSAIDNSPFDIDSLKTNWDLDAHWELDASIGVSPAVGNISSSITTYGAGLTYNW